MNGLPCQLLLLFCALLFSTTLFAQPTITSFSPTAATQGTTITITGTGFTGASAVTIGGTPATSYTVVSATRIDAVAPAASTGNLDIAVTTAAGTATRGGLSFNRPVIQSVHPLTGPYDTAITITGQNFSSTLSANTLYIGSVKATITSATPSAITATVPHSTAYRPVSLSLNGLTAQANLPFSQTFFNRVGASIDTTSFGWRQNVAAGSIHTLADFDDDGKQDLATISINGFNLSVYKNNSASTNIVFDSKVDYTTGNGPRDLCTGDFNGDGKIDIAVVNYTSKSIYIYRNTSTVGAISFAAGQSFATGNNFSSEPMAIAPADVDNDGKLDIVASLYSTGFVVMRNTSSASGLSFTASTPITYGNFSGSTTKLVVTDLDGDTKPEVIISSHFFNNLLVFRNTSTAPGAVSFAAKVEFSVGVTVNNAAALRHVATGDLDGDGKTDLVGVHAESAFVSVLRNTSTSGVISFAPYKSYPLDYGGRYAAVSDMDGDGKPDILTTDNINFSLLKNSSLPGNMSFLPRVNYSLGWLASNMNTVLVPVDVDGDDRPELVTGNNDFNTGQQVAVFRNMVHSPALRSVTPTLAEGGSTVTLKGFRFSNVTSVSFGGVAAASFTIVNDTTITAVIGNGASGEVRVVAPGGSSSISGFAYSPPIPVVNTISATNGTVGSTVTLSGEKFSASGNTILFGAVKGTVIASSPTSITATVPVGATYEAPVVITNHGLTAVAPQAFGTTFSNIGSGLTTSSFTDKSHHTVTRMPWDVSVMDVDGDGRSDMLVSQYGDTGRISILRNITSSGPVLFDSKVDIKMIPGVGGVPYLLAQDLDGDAKPEIVAVQSNTAMVFRNISTPGAVSLDAKKDYAVATFPWDVAAADVDLDGRPDLLTASASGFLSVLRNESTMGNLSFAAKKDFAGVGSPQFFVVEDFDGDRKPDAAMGNGTSNFSLSVFRNNSLRGAVSFTDRFEMPTAAAVNDLAAADLDGDGKKDLVVVTNTNFASVYPNTSTAGTISFGAKMDLPITTVGVNIQFGDVDGDGKVDMVIAHRDNISIFRNTSAGGAISFAPAVRFAHSQDPIKMIVADLNSDSRPEIVCSNRYGTNLITVFRNKIGISDAVLCPPAGSTTLASNLGGTGHQWYVSTDSVNYVPVTNGGNYNGAATASLQLINIPSFWAGRRFKCVSSAGTSNIFTVTFSNNWVGTSGGSWNVASNWSCGVVPDVNTDVVLTSVNIVVTANAFCRSLRLSTGVTVTVQPGANLTVTH